VVPKSKREIIDSDGEAHHARLMVDARTMLLIGEVADSDVVRYPQPQTLHKISVPTC
jgi:hypothetical protein